MNPDVSAFGNVMQIVIVSVVCFVFTGLGARILWRWGSLIKPRERSHPMEGDDRFHRLETAIDTIAIEVERISEAQRFMVGLLGEASQARRAELPLTSRAERTNTPH